MGFKEKLVDKIKRKEAEIQEYEIKIREARIYIQAIQDTIKVLPREDVGVDVTGATENTLRVGSMPHKTYELLAKAKKPLHITDILIGIGVKQTKQVRASLVSSLSTYVKNKQIFTRPLPGTYGLIGMDVISGEPPDNFGLFKEKDEQENS
ncbi:MAG: hypothetical protein C0399_11670 [Syntrophus sp. (in: bacteria)]|nr:hypothetical protein [Syntrophus sp. (in: bacteria)]